MSNAVVTEHAEHLACWFTLYRQCYTFLQVEAQLLYL